MPETILKNVPFATVKVSSDTEKIDCVYETLLSSTREEFVQSTLSEKEFQYGTKFRKTFHHFNDDDEFVGVSCVNVSPEFVIELDISFRYKDFSIPVGSVKQQELKDLPRIVAVKEEEVDKKKDKIKTLTFKNKIHGQVYLTGDKINEEYELALIGMEHSSSEDRKKNFITYTTRAASEQYRKTFFQEFKTVNRYDEIVSVMYKTEKGDMQLLIRFEKKDVEVRVLYTNSGMEVLDNDNILLLEKELRY